MLDRTLLCEENQEENRKKKKLNYEKELRKSMNKGSVGKILFMSM